MPNRRDLAHLVAIFVVTFLFLNLTEYGSLSFFSEARNLLRETGASKAGLYVIAYILVISSYVAVLLSPGSVPRAVLFVLSALVLGVHFTFKEINHYGLKYFEARTVLGEAKFMADAFKGFYIQIAVGALKALACAGLLFLPSRLVQTRVRARWILLAPISFALTYMILYKTSGTRDVFPVTYRGLALAGLVQFGTGDQMYYGPKLPVRLQPGSTGARKVVFIVDEAVRADFLTINNSMIEATPFLASKTSSLTNLGVATSGAVCSVDSNTILRSGLMLSKLPSRDGAALALPTYFQYAKSAGYRTYYLDAQSNYGQLQNHMSTFDLAYIDEVVYLRGKKDDVPYSKVDYELARKLGDILRSDERSFVVANKNGAHFVYNDRYPESEAVFKPVMSTTAFFTSDITEMINSYANVIRWNVDGFFKELFPTLETTEDLALVYTSDHGASFGNGGDHCTVLETPFEQAMVPLFIMGAHGRRPFGSTGFRPNRSTHFEIFPSLLVYMGYPKDIVEQEYGPTLWTGGPNMRQFISGDIFGRAGQYFVYPFNFSPDELPYEFDKVRRQSELNRKAALN